MSTGIICPACGGDTQVVDSRPSGQGIRRRRRCIACGERVTTHELTTTDRSAYEMRIIAVRHELRKWLGGKHDG